MIVWMVMIMVVKIIVVRKSFIKNLQPSGGPENIHMLSTWAIHLSAAVRYLFEGRQDSLSPLDLLSQARCLCALL